VNQAAHALQRAIVPYPPLAGRICLVTFVVWAAFHIALLMLGIPLPAFPAMLLLVAAPAAATWLDMRRAEHLFFANLGISPTWSGAAAILAAAFLEAAYQVGYRSIIGPGGPTLLG
jgi:hypothetical protein